ncbi:MAG: disulfide bond formation protein B [Halofilum sp. (in: g-proteobacteria)]
MSAADRLANAAGATVCIGALLYGILYLQGRLGLEPCPLCILDRVAFALAAVVFVLAALHAPGTRGRRLYALGALLPLGFGVATAGRHVWLQSLPADQVPACGPSLGYTLENFPLQRAIDLVLRGSGSCAETQWQFLGGSIALWTLVLFSGLTLLGLWLLFKPAR